MSSFTEFLNKLNPEQRKAVEHKHGPILVLAGAGSGKTRVLTYRVAHLVLTHNVNPGNILAVTFTNKATDEMRERLKVLLGNRADELWVATFHSTCLKILRRCAAIIGYQNNFTVYDDTDSKQVIKKLMKSMSIDPREYTPQQFAAAIDRAKNSLVSPEELLADARGYKNQLYAEVYDRYQKELRLENAMDFGDLLVNTWQVLSTNTGVCRNYQEQFEYILVDEFQDTNTIQYKIIKLLAAKHRNILVVGDDDQSIYAFRGATVENILSFERDFSGARTIKLEQNYRSSGIILDAANAVISKNNSRKKKKLWTQAERGQLVKTYVAFDQEAEAAFIAREVKKLQNSSTTLNDIAVFYRTNAQSRALEDAFISHGIMYRIFGGLKFYDRKEVKDILAYLRLLVSDRDNQAFIRILNTPARGIGAKTLQDLANLASERSISLWQTAVEQSEHNAKLEKFVGLIQELRLRVEKSNLASIIESILDATGYLKKLTEDDTKESQSRIENIRELVAVAKAFVTPNLEPYDIIQSFLDRVSLTSGSDTQTSDNASAKSTGFVSFMTLHLAKGLEYPVVFFSGLEEGLLPHFRSLNNAEDIEEERRLCYVGITRAMQQLYLTRALRRSMFSAGAGFTPTTSGNREVSRFIIDIPDQYFEHLGDSFCSAYDDYEDNDFDQGLAPFRSSLSNRNSQKLSKLQNKLNLARNLLRPATDLAEPQLNAAYSTKPIADYEQIIAGSRVVHPSFGAGEVLSIVGNADQDLAQSKVLIKFDQESDTRKLVLGKARLVLE